MSQDQHEGLASTLQSQSSPSFVAEMLSEADRIIVTARGQLDLNSQPIFALALAKAIAAGPREVVIDLEALDSIDSEDVGLLVRARSFLRSRGQHLVVRSSCANAEVLVACARLDPSLRLGQLGENARSTFSSATT